jgi:DNA invertase Pin-like site-specific DNA recombinase
MKRRAFSYARFSSKEQAEGRSLDRQLKLARSFCKRHGYTLDDRTFVDEGVSGWTGANATHGDLGVFLGMVEEGRIPRGSILIIEKLNRLSRLPPHEANAVIMAIVNAGVDIATTSPEQVFTRSNIGTLATWLPLQIAQCLAHQESEDKSDWLSDAWTAKRETVGRDGAEKMTKKGVAWVRITADRKGWVVLEDKAAMARRAFELADSGLGVSLIAGVLNAEHPEGMTGRGWQHGTVHDLLRSRAVLGEYQPHVGTCAKKGRKKTRRPAGEPVQGYFPAIVDEKLFDRVQEALTMRKTGGGHREDRDGPGTRVTNLFNGLVWDARDGQSMVVNGNVGRRFLVSSGAVRKLPGSEFRMVSLDLFEQAVLTLFRELKPGDVTGKPGEAEDRVADLSARLAAVNRKLEATRARAAAEDSDDITVFFELLKELEQQKIDLAARLEEAAAEAAGRDADNFGEFTSLAGLLDAAALEERDRLRARVRLALRRMVEEMLVLVVPAGRTRLVAVQVFFKSTRRRDYLLVLRSATTGREASWEAVSMVDTVGPGDFSLKDREQVLELELALRGAVEGLRGRAARKGGRAAEGKN